MSIKTNDVMLTMDDEQLVRLVWNSSMEAFEVLALRYQDKLFQVTRGLLRNREEDAEDCAQDTLIKIYLAMTERRKPDNPAKFWPYMISIARNVAMDRHRDHKRTADLHKRATDLYELVSLRHTQSYNEDLILEISEAVDTLPREEREVIKLYYYEGYGVDGISKIIGYGQPYVSKRKRKGEDMLRKMIQRTRGGDLK